MTPKSDVRALGVDPGTKRIGVAVSDRSGTIATPLHVIAAPSRRAAIDELVQLAARESAEVVVVGLPIHMNGRAGASANAARRLASDLSRLLDMPVVLHDERRTTAQAEREMIDAGLDAKKRRQMVDKVAASIMLQSWLDGPRRIEPVARGRA